MSQNDTLNCRSPYGELTAVPGTNIMKKVEAEARKNLQEHYSDEDTAAQRG